MKASAPIHPFLLAVFPILFLLSENLGETELPEAVPPLLLSVALTALTFLVARAILGDGRRAGLVVSLAVCGVLLFGHAANLVRPVGLTEGKVLAGWLVAGGVAVLVALRTRRDLAGATLALNVLAAVLTLNAIGTIALHEVRVATTAKATTGLTPTPATMTPATTAAATSASPGRGPGDAPVDPDARDIYYIVVEDYGSQRTVEENLGLPDGGFLDRLEGKGFDVLTDTRSNYGRTPLSLASSLNMTYLDDLAARLGKDWLDYAPIVDMVRAPGVATFLRDRGYRFVQVGGQFRLTAMSTIADVNPVYRDTSDFAGVLYDTTIVPAVVHRLGLDDGRDGRRRNYDAVVWQLDQVRKVAQLPGPKFVFVHIFLPHHPYVVGADGAYVPRDVAAGIPVREQQAAQWRFVEREVERIVDQVIAGPESADPIVIVSTDEGPNPDGMPTVGGDLAWGTATDAQLDQKFSIFAAYYLPGVHPGDRLYPTMSSVNTFRLVFDLYFDAGLPLLPDRAWIHSDKHHPLDLTDVTDRLDAFRQAGATP